MIILQAFNRSIYINCKAHTVSEHKIITVRQHFLSTFDIESILLSTG